MGSEIVEKIRRSSAIITDRLDHRDRWMIALTAIIAGGGIVSAVIFGEQLSVMRGQLAEMESAGKQTDELIAANKKLAETAAKQAEVASSQLRVMQSGLEDNKAQRHLIIAETRASVVYQGIDLHPMDENGKYVLEAGQNMYAWSVNPVLENTGATEARNYTAWWDLSVKPFRPDGDNPIYCPTAPRPQTAGNVKEILSADSQSILVSKRLSVQDGLDAATTPPLKTIYIYGSAEFNDIFFPETKTHHFDWCVLANPAVVERSEFSFVILKADGD